MKKDREFEETGACEVIGDLLNSKSFRRDDLVFNVTADILVAMEQLGISKSDLARKLSKSKSYVTQTLSGARNMTLGTLSDICFVLNIQPTVKVRVLGKSINQSDFGGVTKTLRASKVLASDDSPKWDDNVVQLHSRRKGLERNSKSKQTNVPVVWKTC